MSTAGPALERAEADRVAGRPWKARDRLTGALASVPADQAVLRALAEVCAAMGDLPAAGRYWFLTEAASSDVDRATAAMYERHPTPVSLFTALPLKAELAEYPPSVQRRLSSLAAEAERPWLRGTPKFKRVAGEPPEPKAGLGAEAAVGALLVGTVGVWFVGAVAIARKIRRTLP